jgi:hypothetical protein
MSRLLTYLIQKFIPLFLGLYFVFSYSLAIAEAPISSLPNLESPNLFQNTNEQWSMHGQTTYIVQQKK